ncbi:MAG: DUF6259 domain-containing protein, partial [Candidatus Omnitrophica bacterium]|nr:DUF6259 domain-containing protein [Candidatus Omnitrophota bacterium]
MEVTQNNGEIIISSEYWEVKHSKKNGGTISSIIFKFGSNKNIIAKPFTSLMVVKEKSSYSRYYEFRCSNPQISVTEGKQDIIVKAKGFYTSDEGNPLKARYKTTYHYMNYGLVKISLEIDIIEPIKELVAFTMLDFESSGSLNTLGYRACAKQGFAPSFFEKVIWKEFSQRPHYNNIFWMGRNMPAYFCLLQRRVEGLEIFSPSTVEGNQLNKESSGFYQTRYDDINNNIKVEFSPYGEWQIPKSIKKGKYLFSYFLGLPFSKGKNIVHKPYFHSMINNRWPDEKQLDILANSGVKILRLHNDYSEDGIFWRDGSYPPYDRENMKKMDWVIEQAHKRAMKIVPYFSLKELHPETPEFKKFGEEWKRTIDAKGTIIHNYAGSGEFGCQMCLCSGWSRFRKTSVDLVLKRHNFDGVYYDWVCSLYCNNPLHAGGMEHTDI